MTIENKTAVLVTGIYPSQLQRFMLQSCLDKIKEKFEGCDFYYQCWDTPQNRYIMKKVNEDILWMTQPVSNYNPYRVAIQDEYISENQQIKFKIKKPQRQMQLIGFHYLFESIEKSYDYYFRTRWDAVISDNFDLNKAQEMVDENVVGYNFLTRHEFHHGKTGHYRLRYDRYRERRLLNKYYFENNKPQGYQEESELVCYNNFLFDFMIGFKKEDYNRKANSLLASKKLYPAEWGWHQLLTNQRKHVNIDGLVSIVRNLEGDYETWEKLSKAKLL